MQNLGSSTPRIEHTKTFSRPSAKQPNATQALAARRLFGSFRKGDANDPETYVAAVLTVLMDYSDAVVNEVCHPGRGLPARCDFLPTMKEIKDACEGEAARADRMQTYAKLGTTQRRLPAPPSPMQPTIFTPQGFPHYDKLVRRYEAGDRPAHYETRECVDKVVRPGIWTPFSWIDDAPIGAKGFKPMSDAELRAFYPPAATAAPPVERQAEEGIPF
jgi:hypothetical protein